MTTKPLLNDGMRFMRGLDRRDENADVQKDFVYMQPRIKQLVVVCRVTTEIWLGYPTK